MRPGFYTRKSQAVIYPFVVRGVASMRPGFYTRKSAPWARATAWAARCFNEAGILHPEKRAVRGLVVQHVGASMRPGFYTRKSPGAQCVHLD